MLTQARLPLWSVVFVDWHGVLSHDPFWSSVLGGRGTLRRALEDRLHQVFEPRSGLSDGWMRGRTDTDVVFAPVIPALGRSRRSDFLRRRIVQDCLSMRLDPRLANALADAVPRVQVVVATDNTPDFEHAFRTAQRRRQIDDVSTLRGLAPLLDGVICSSTTGVFKAEDPHGFFGPWLETSCLGFEDALLIDDRADNCEAFHACGGHALHWRPDEHQLADLNAWIDEQERAPRSAEHSQ